MPGSVPGGYPYRRVLKGIRVLERDCGKGRIKRAAVIFRTDASYPLEEQGRTMALPPFTAETDTQTGCPDRVA
jgi:hypothetical protein